MRKLLGEYTSKLTEESTVLEKPQEIKKDNRSFIHYIKAKAKNNQIDWENAYKDENDGYRWFLPLKYHHNAERVARAIRDNFKKGQLEVNVKILPMPDNIDEPRYVELNFRNKKKEREDANYKWIPESILLLNEELNKILLEDESFNEVIEYIISDICNRFNGKQTKLDNGYKIECSYYDEDYTITVMVEKENWSYKCLIKNESNEKEEELLITENESVFTSVQQIRQAIINMSNKQLEDTMEYIETMLPKPLDPIIDITIEENDWITLWYDIDDDMKITYEHDDLIKALYNLNDKERIFDEITDMGSGILCLYLSIDGSTPKKEIDNIVEGLKKVPEIIKTYYNK